jgi:quinoprotein glucose dehydrogenase
MPTYESDVCIVGSGISAAMLSEKLSELKSGLAITIVEAGNAIFNTRGERRALRQRALDYGESPWPNDFIEDQIPEGIISITMAVGGQALYWGGACNRFTEEDLRLSSLYGLAEDWPLEWKELEEAYGEAERRLNVCGDPSPFPGDRRSTPYPVAAMPLPYSLQQLKTWAEKSGLPFTPLPVARNLDPTPDGRGICCGLSTCTGVCPQGARYSPDFTFRKLTREGKLVLHDRTLIRKLVLDDTRPIIAAAQGVHRDRPDETVEYRARLFVLAAGYCWSPHLLLLSACSRFPNGLANSSGVVGRYMTGHKFLTAFADIDVQLYPGQNTGYSLISRQYLRCPTDKPYVRHDTRVWESTFGREARLRDDDGRLLLGDECLEDWRQRSQGGSVRLRAYYDVHPSRDSTLSLNPSRRNRFGDSLPTIVHRFDEATIARQERVEQHISNVFNELARANNGRVLTMRDSSYLDHPGGGCRMGSQPETSVCDSYGQSHDHENLFVVGAPTVPSGGCTNGALTFVALSLRSAGRIAQRLGSH